MKYVAVVVLLTVIASCQQDPYANLDSPSAYFSKGRIGSSPDYAIVKWGNPRDHVATAHGFADDRSGCQEIADALNVNACKETNGEDCLNPFSCIAQNE